MFEIDFSSLSKEAFLYEKIGDKVRCLACRNYCQIKNGGRGKCFVRFNKDGVLYSPYGYVTALNIDPIEKKPLYHFLPGSKTLSFGMAGCNFKCDYCQNWNISQFIRDKYAYTDFLKITPEEIVKILLDKNLKILVSTYNEPAITVEWAKEIFSIAKSKNNKIKTGFVSNGYISRESLEFLKGKIDFIKVDLKSFNKERYKSLTGAHLDELKKAIEDIYSYGIHIEIVILLVVEFNDSEDELRQAALFIKNISPDIPVHITAFHPDYKMMDKRKTELEDIEKACGIMKNSGLRFVYGGNVISTKLSTTYCPSCGTILVKRGYMSTEKNNLITENGEGYCPNCKYKIYGIF